MVEGRHAPDIFKEFLDLFHQMDQDPKEQHIEGIGSYYFMGFTMEYMPECVVDICDAVRFQLFNVGIVISSSIPRAWSCIVWSIWEFSKLIGGGRCRLDSGWRLYHGS